MAVDTGGFWQEDSQPHEMAAFITAATADKEETNPNTDTSHSSTNNNKKNDDINRSNNNNKNDDNVDDDDKEKVTESRKDCNDESSLLLLPWTRLKRLGEQQQPTNANLSARDMIDILDRMGENHETMWPHDWSLIQQATQDVVPNLHSGSSTPRAAFELVPKSIIARQQQRQQQDTSPPNDSIHSTNSSSSSSIHSTMQVLVQSNRMKSLLKRKRELQEEPPQRSVVRRRRPAPSPLPAIPRQPSSHAKQEEWEWAVIRQTVENKEELIQEMVHREDYPDPDAVLLGALKPVGRFHYCYKSDDNDDEPGWTDKQKRRAVRKAAKERLYPLTVLKDDRDSHKQQQQQQRHLTTKVVRARHDATDDYYTEFDLGECILECNGKVCAFSSLEVSLKDEKKKKTPN